MLFYIVLYLTLCAIIGLFARHQPMGFLGYFLISIVLTPVGGAFILIILIIHTRAAMRKQQELAELEQTKSKKA